MEKKTIRDIDLKNKRVIMRVDYNVPLDDQGNITDTTRIVATLPTIEYIRKQNTKLILMSHLGRPKGVDPKLSLTPVSKKLSELLNIEVKMVDNCIGEKVEKAISQMNFSDVLLLENLRFHKEEEANDENFARSLANLADVYVNDAFGTAHRAHASTAGIAKFIPAVAGFLLEKEVEHLSKILKNPQKPFVLVLGGAKISTKIGVIENLIDKVDKILIGGGMVYTFLKAKGINVGDSLVESDQLVKALQIIKKAEELNIKFVLPVDHIVAEEISDKAKPKSINTLEIPAGYKGVDIGPKTIKLFEKELREAKTIFWNGPMGIFEYENFAEGTNTICKTIAKSKAITVVGGGDSVSAVEKLNLSNKFTHVSTGGGASLEFLEGKVLPGVSALLDK